MMKRLLPLLLVLFAPAAFAQFNTLTDGTFTTYAGVCPDVNGQHLNWGGNLPGGGPICGTSTAPAVVTVGTPTSRALSLATAYQATNNAKAAFVTVNLTSSASLSIATGTTNTAEIVIGSTVGVASGTGSLMGPYLNSLTGTLVVGLAVNTGSTTSYTLMLPAGWYFAVRQTAGSVTIASAYDQSIG